MEEGEKEEQVVTAEIGANSPEEEEEEEESKISDEAGLKTEAAATKNETTPEKHDEKRPAAEQRDTKEEVWKGGMAKEPSKKAPVSSFFGEATSAWPSTVPVGVEARGHMCCFIISTAPRKAAVKMERAEMHEGEKKRSAELKTSADEDKDAKR